MVSAGIELIFFTLAGIVLCFEISMEKTPVEITHRCLGCCWVALILVKDMSSLPWVHKKLGGEGAQLREQIQTDQRDIPYHVTSCPVC